MKKVKRLYTVTDLGPGDGGKGGVVHKISSSQSAHTIIKVGGAQGSHGVRTSSGEGFAFSQFGCGTFEDTRTHISPLFVFDPIGLLREAQMLNEATNWRHGDVCRLVTIDEDALAITPYHGVTSRLEEMARKHNARGTIGVGVGIAYRDSLRAPELAIHAADLLRPGLREKLEAVREYRTRELENVIAQGFLPEDEEYVTEQLKLLHYPLFVDWTLKNFEQMAMRVKIVDREHLRREILARDGVVVVESSHGILTDFYHGFQPHTSKLRTLPRFTHQMLRDCGYDGQVFRLGVTRAYQIRHGAGPLVTDDPHMVERLLPGSHKEENRYQGKVRVGPLDLVMLRYAIAVSGGPSAYDGLAITWFDQLRKDGFWRVCAKYGHIVDTSFFSGDDIVVGGGEDKPQLERQAQLTRVLLSCTPVLSEYPVDTGASSSELIALCKSVLEPQLHLPVKMVSLGPTENEKILV